MVFELFSLGQHGQSRFDQIGLMCVVFCTLARN